MDMTNAQIHQAGINAVVGELVHQHMWRQKITQTALAQVLGVSQPAIAKKVRGERPFSIDELLTVAAHLNLPITDLLPNAGRPDPEGSDLTGAPGRARTDDNPIKSRELYQLSYRGEDDGTATPELPAAESSNPGTAD
jgi:predicted XRE-type DNA-binding protein